ncbi:MAG: dihydrofolate reductase, partial [Peptococcaceae bacterium]|nr:dihydrofolate reductase [Peptococcaceae bacterium]
SLAEALELASREIIFIIGGQQLYKEALPLAEYLDLTFVDAEPEGDTFFPEVNWNDYEEVSREQHAGEPAYTFVTYCKRSE